MRKAAPARRTLSIAALAAALVWGGAGQARPEHYDLIIRGGAVYDGSPAPGRLADVGIRGDRIVRIGAIPRSVRAERVIDARGRYVAPGFIDPHSHAEPGIETEELASAHSILLQGVTTVLLNLDGEGPADLRNQAAAIEARTPGVNVALAIGHGAVRREVLGAAERKATPEELARMQALVKNAMDFGAFGLSSGPFYVPGRYADTAELAEMAKVVAPYPGAFHASHIRDEASFGIGVFAAVDELIEVSRRSGVTGVVSHIKMLGPSVWGRADEVIAKIDAARAEGLSIWADQYPYEASGTYLFAALLPELAEFGGRPALVERLKDPKEHTRLRAKVADNLKRRGGPDTLMIDAAGTRLSGRARTRGLDPVDAALELMVEADVPVTSFSMLRSDVEAFMRQPWTMTSTDSALTAVGYARQHPRAYGAYPRKIGQFALDEGVIPVEQAIRSSSGLTAEVMGLKDRGRLEPGAFADVVVFDPAAFRDRASYAVANVYPTGLEWVLVNGKVAVEGGKLAPARHGRLLRRTTRPAS